MFNFKVIALLLVGGMVGYHYYGDIFDQQFATVDESSEVLAIDKSPAVYKCKDENGAITYSQIACMDSALLVKQLNLGRSQSASQKYSQCGLVRNFAAETGIAVFEKVPIAQLMTRYGGEQQIPPEVANIIRSVYKFQSRSYRTVENSINHENDKCIAGDYGDLTCEQFPDKFVQSYGNCTNAANTVLRLKRISPYVWGGSKNNDGKKQANYSRSQVTYITKNKPKAGTTSSLCFRKLTKKLERNKESSRSADSAREHDSYRAERRSLEKKLARCKAQH